MVEEYISNATNYDIDVRGVWIQVSWHPLEHKLSAKLGRSMIKLLYYAQATSMLWPASLCCSFLAWLSGKVIQQQSRSHTGKSHQLVFRSKLLPSGRVICSVISPAADHQYWSMTEAQKHADLWSVGLYKQEMWEPCFTITDGPSVCLLRNSIRSYSLLRVYYTISRS